MNKIFRKALAVILSAVMVFTALPFAGVDFSDFSAWAAEYITGEVFTLGSYPQKRVSDSNLLNELNSYTLLWENAGSFSGNGSIGSMSEDSSLKYFDVEHNGKMFRAVTFTNYRPELTYRKSTEKNSYQDDNGYKTNTVYWFEYEPLKWRVVDGEQGIAVSESLVDAQAFANEVYKIENLYYADQSGKTAANSYADSTIADWLNGDFMSTAFTEAEKEQLAFSKLGDGDFDKIFLPSQSEISALSASELTASGTDYAKAMGLYAVDGGSFWWLRDSGYYSHYARRVSDIGSTDKYGNSVDFTSFGVRPAIRLDGGIGGAYTATFDYENGKTVSDWFVSGEAIAAPEAPEAEGYEFAGWIDSVTGEAMPEKMPAANVTYVPNWKPADGVAYSVETYIMNTDGTGYDKTVAVKYGTTGETAAADTAAKEGFTLDTDSSVVSAAIKADGTTVLKVYYSRNKYSVTINGAANEYYFGSSITLTAPAAAEGTAFSHWENQSGETVVSPFTVPAQATVITPVFSTLSFEVTFVADGEIYRTGNYEYGTVITAPEAPKKEGYSFIGWSLDGIGTLGNLGTVPVGGVVFKAIFNINNYSISYYVYNPQTQKNEKVKTGSGEYGSVIDAQLDYEVPAGYTLSQAYTDRACTVLLNEGATVPARSVELYYKLIPEVYNAIFDANGGLFSDGTEIKTVPTAFDTEIIAPENPTREGYDFNGWDDVVSVMGNKDKTFTATWTPSVYTVSYYDNLGLYEEFEVNYGDELDIPADPYVEGFEFIGWAESEDSTEIAELPEFMPAKDLVYYAIFVKTDYKVTWIIDGVSTEEFVTFGMPITAPETPSKVGYTFAGWDPEVPAVMPETDLTFTAKWEYSKENTLSFRTEFYKQNPDTEEWEVTDTVLPGDTVKARLFIGTNYYTNAGNFMVFYDNRFFEDNYRSGTSLLMTTNYEAIGSEETYIAGSFAKLASNHNLLVSMVANGYLTQSFIDTHQAFTCQYTFTPSTSVMFDGNYWFAEFKLKVKEDASGTGDFFVAEGTVQNASQRPAGFTNIPLNKENGSATDSTALYNLDINLAISSRPVTLVQTVATNSVSKRELFVETQASSDSIALSSAQTELEYTWVYFENKTYTPTVYLKYKNEPFDAQKELEITYKNNSKVGVAAAELEGINRFTGTSKLDFIISNEAIPSQVKNLKAEGGLNKIELSWTSSASKFNIYRRIEGGAYTLLTSTASKAYTDTAVQTGVSYYYQVSAVGAFDVEGEKSEEASAAAFADTQAPSNVTMNSSSGSTISGTATFTASATDNDRPSKAVYSYSTDGGKTWIPMGEASDSSFTCTLDTTAIQNGTIKVKVVFEDAAGNKSNPFISEYEINNAPAFTMEIRQPSQTTIKYGDAIYLHADITGELPAGAKVKWISSNGNFSMEVSADTLSCKISPAANGSTTFTAVVVDANDNPIAPEDTQDMTSKAGFFQKIIAFFKKLFGLTKTYPEKIF